MWEPIDISALECPEPNNNDDNSLASVAEVVAGGPFAAEWESLRQYRPPLWYADAKFGISLHWGVYSVPAFENEWYSRSMYLEGSPAFEHHRAVYGPQSEFGYKDFIPHLRMEKFDPEEWAAVFRRAGAQFVVPVAEHHDGFAMYDSARSRWTAARMGPRRDVLGELLAAVDKAWMVRGASTHRAEHWFFMNGGTRFQSDVLDPRLQDFYGPAQREETAPNEKFLQDWLLRCVEIIDRYRPQVLFFDWWIEQPAFEPYLRTLAAYYYNRAAQWGRGVVINYKWGAFAAGSAVLDVERGTVSGVAPSVWQNDTSVSKSSWCWVEDHEYKSADDLIAELADVVSRNGVLQLNIGPKPDGTIPEAERGLLQQMGEWLSRRGEAIYGTRPWVIAAEGPTRMEAGSFTDSETPLYSSNDIRFTTRTDVTGEYVYAILLARPEGMTRVRSFGTGAGLLEQEIREVSVLGSPGPVAWSRDSEGLEITVPNDALPAHGGPVIKLYLEPRTTPPRKDFLHG